MNSYVRAEEPEIVTRLGVIMLEVREYRLAHFIPWAERAARHGFHQRINDEPARENDDKAD